MDSRIEIVFLYSAYSFHDLIASMRFAISLKRLNRYNWIIYKGIFRGIVTTFPNTVISSNEISSHDISKIRIVS